MHRMREIIYNDLVERLGLKGLGPLSCALQGLGFRVAGPLLYEYEKETSLDAQRACLSDVCCACCQCNFVVIIGCRTGNVTRLSQNAFSVSPRTTAADMCTFLCRLPPKSSSEQSGHGQSHA